MLHIAGGIILAVLFFNLLPVLVVGIGVLFRWLFITIAWLLVWFAGFYVVTHIPDALENLFDPNSSHLWFWFALAAIGTIVIVRKGLTKPIPHHHV